MIAFIASLIGGFVGILIVSYLAEYLLIKRIVNSAALGKPLSVAIGWVLAIILATLTMGTAEGLATYTPGALLLGPIAYLRGKKVDEQNARDDPLRDIFS